MFCLAAFAKLRSGFAYCARRYLASIFFLAYDSVGNESYISVDMILFRVFKLLMLDRRNVAD